MFDFDPRDYDSRDDERHGKTPSGGSHGGPDNRDRDDDWTQPDTQTRDRDDDDARSLGRGPGNDRQGSVTPILRRRATLGPHAFVFGTESGAFQQSFKTAWEALLLCANGHETKRLKPGAWVDRDDRRLGTPPATEGG
jgi:hypothetical protein